MILRSHEVFFQMCQYIILSQKCDGTLLRNHIYVMSLDISFLQPRCRGKRFVNERNT